MLGVHLDLGGTIWLDVSRKLLNFHRYFFTPFEKMPKEVFEEFKHHSHTHPSVEINSDNKTHLHTNTLIAVACGYSGAGSHSHTLNMDSGNGHAHTVTLNFGSANLGDPNWWEHVHVITGSCGDGGTSHTHTFPSYSSFNGCDLIVDSARCIDNKHRHAKGGSTCGSGGTAHSHNLPSVNTGNASEAESPSNHRHSVSFNLNDGGSHNHAISGVSAVANCWQEQSHNHGNPENSPSVSHNHSISGYSGYGGEIEVVIPTVTTEDATNIERY